MAFIAVGEKLRELRLRDKLTQDDVVQRFSMSRSAYSLYENGKRRPSFELLVQFANFYDVSTDYLLGRIPTYYPENNFKFDLSAAKVDMINLILKTNEKLYSKIKDVIDYLNFKHAKEEPEEFINEEKQKKLVGIA
ncbi:MAG: helix-turn-helix transcriptional regulator [Selenomonadaceae bacterium]|nr:helix-turn-helix transcriptional regulator [Selenomonadaceae bacterium]